MNGAVLAFVAHASAEPGMMVVEVGSMNVNGSPRSVFPNTEYVGIDIRTGKGVDVVMSAEDLPAVYGAESFDRVVMCETLEHCKDWKGALMGAWVSLKTGGLMCLTTPTIRKARHNYPSDYWRWTLADYRQIFATQDVLRCEDIYNKGIGVIVRKVGNDLDTDLVPYAVP